MRKYIIGIVLGAVGTLAVQNLYRTNEKFQRVLNTVSKEFGLDKTNESGRTLNLFDKMSLIWQRFRR